MTPQQAAGAARRLGGLGFALAAQAFLLLSACALHQPYPVAAWGPPPPPPAEDCRHFEGSYREVGEMAGEKYQPPLAWELFGDNPKLGRATRVSFSLPTDDVLNVTVWEGMNPLFARTLTRPRKFTCEAGRLVIRNKRLVGGTMVFGWESVEITLSATDDYLVAQVKKFTAALVFIFVPIAAKETFWYRFQRERE